MRRAVSVVLLVALALPAAASALVGDPERYKLDWVEHARKNGRIVMTFRVKQVYFEGQAWAAQVEFHNRSAQTIRIRPQFALLLSRTRRGDADYQALLARRAKPALPKILFPGQRWQGAIAGPGRPRNDTYVRVNFGFFAVKGLFADSPNGFAWITDHVFQFGEVA